MDTRTMARLFGVVFLVVGILGFIPGITQMHSEHEGLVVGGPGHGYLLGLFHVNLAHNVVHLLFGVMGLAMGGTLGGARNYFRVVAVAYLLLTVMGLISAANMRNTFGLVPIHGTTCGCTRCSDSLAPTSASSSLRPRGRTRPTGRPTR